MKHLGFILGFCFSVACFAADHVNVRLFSDRNLSNVQLTAVGGHYAWIAYSKDESVIDTVAIASPRLKREYDLRVLNGELVLTREARPLGKYAHLRCVPLFDTSYFQIDGAGRIRDYEGEVWFRVDGGHIIAINHISITNYLAGVVQSEGGHFREIEYFKAQAALAHTWLLANWEKHSSEGYNVKDDVTSQVYFGRADNVNSALIREAVVQVGDTVLIDGQGKPILGVFHANSGGQTANSQDAWSGHIDYLQSIEDPYSMRGSAAFWEKSINKEEFLRYIAGRMGVSATDANFRVAVLEYQPSEREGRFEYNGRSLKWRDVRTHFGLRSAWFSIAENGSNVLLKGRGFGHGVGLSQEGANVMAQEGFDWKEILNHYFRGIQLVSSTTL